MSQTPTKTSSRDEADLKHIAEEAQQTLSREVERAKVASRDYAKQAKDEAFSRAEGGRKHVAGEVSRFAEALHDAAGKLDDGSIQAQLLHRAASGVDEAAANLKEKNLNDMAAAVTSFGRRNPAVFVGGAALLGFALARFAAASTPTEPVGKSPKSTPARGGKH